MQRCCGRTHVFGALGREVPDVEHGARDVQPVDEPLTVTQTLVHAVPAGAVFVVTLVVVTPCVRSGLMLGADGSLAVHTHTRASAARPRASTPAALPSVHAEACAVAHKHAHGVNDGNAPFRP